MRRFASVVPPILLLLLLVAPSVDADPPNGDPPNGDPPHKDACAHTTPGRILVPTFTATRPTFVSQTFTQGTYAYYVTGLAIYQGQDFSLTPDSRTSTIGIDDDVRFPDFHIAWYVEDGIFASHVGTSASAGSEEGNVPWLATAALIWMQYGPDGGTSDGTPGAAFVLEIDCQ